MAEHDLIKNNEEVKHYEEKLFILSKMIEKRLGITNLFPKGYIQHAYREELRKGKDYQDSYTKVFIRMMENWECVGRFLE